MLILVHRDFLPASEHLINSAAASFLTFECPIAPNTLKGFERAL